MKLTKTVVGNQQTLCLCKLATDPKFVSEVGTQLDVSVWEDSWAAILYGYIESYTRHYDEPAMPMLKQIAKDRANTVNDEDTAEATVRFASRLQEYYKEHASLFVNDKYIRDTVLRWVKERNLIVLNEKLSEAIEGGRLEQAEDYLHKYSEIKQVEFTTVDMMSDVNKIANAYEEERNELVTLSGDFGNLVGPLSRGDIMLILGESGTGKSWTGLHIGLDMAQAGLSVLYVNLENTESQMIRRIYSHMTGCPRDSKEVTIPYFVPSVTEYNDDGDDLVATRWKIATKKVHKEAPNLDKEVMKKFLDNRVMESNGGRFLLESFAPRELTIKGLEHELDNLMEYKNFVPDAVIVDYGDLLRPENAREDKRIQIDSLYLGLRSLALSRNILVISPVQSNRAGYGHDVKKANMAENIGNVNHASIIIGLAHTEVEKEQGITRVSILKRRDGLEKADSVVCLGCLDIGRPIMASKYKSVVDIGNNKQEEDDDE